jgi:hypothetical protein
MRYKSHPKERKAEMREEKTAETKDALLFEEQVLAKFDLVDERLDDVTVRLGKLEEPQYAWERFWAALEQLKKDMTNGFLEIKEELKVINSRHRQPCPSLEA